MHKCSVVRRAAVANAEANLNIYDAEFAQQQIAIFERDLRSARRITLEQWRKRPWCQRSRELLVAWVSSQL